VAIDLHSFKNHRGVHLAIVAATSSASAPSNQQSKHSLHRFTKTAPKCVHSLKTRIQNLMLDPVLAQCFTACLPVKPAHHLNRINTIFTFRTGPKRKNHLRSITLPGGSSP